MTTHDHLPADWSDPNFDRLEKVHCWRRYVSKPVQDLWPTFTESQRMALAANFNELASEEEWP